jgi:hypothetical protein
MSKTPGLDAATKFEDRVISPVVIARERSRPSSKEFDRVLCASPQTEVVGYPGNCIEFASRLGPDIDLARLARARIEHSDGSLVSVQHSRTEHEVAMRIEQRH